MIAPDAPVAMHAAVLAEPPLVSVIIIFLNAAPFIAEALDSVYAQTYPAWELVLVDDGGSDGTDALARTAAAARPDRVRCISHEGRANRGTSISRNVGLKAARGEYVLYLDADDVLTPDCLQILETGFHKAPGVDLVVAKTLFWYWDARYAGRLDHVQHYGRWRGRAVAPSFLTAMIRDEDLHPANCSTMIRRRTLADLGGFEKAFPGMYEDTVALAKLLLRCDAYVCDDVVSAYRLHFASQCHEAAASGVYANHAPNPSRQAYLRWLRSYVADDGSRSIRLRLAIARQLSAYSPRVRTGLTAMERVLKFTRRGLRKAGRLAGVIPRASPPEAAGAVEPGVAVLAALRDFYTATGRPAQARDMEGRRLERTRRLA